jgi:hypothetical protein
MAFICLFHKLSLSLLVFYVCSPYIGNLMNARSHKVLMDRNSGDEADSAKDFGSSQCYHNSRHRKVLVSLNFTGFFLDLISWHTFSCIYN